jgi:hypothetical protein
MTWQEDPAGLQRGEAEGPGDGASGAKVSKGTDIWYAYTTDLVQDPLALRHTRTPLSDHSRYDTTQADGYPMVGAPGSIEKHGASRSQRGILNDQGTFRALVAYEETKGEGDTNKGKTVRYHAFPFDAPPQNGAPDDRAGVAGTLLSDPLESARRVRFVQQGPSGTHPALAIFWRQGPAFEGSPSDILLKASAAVGEAEVLAAPTLNLSSDTPHAGPANLSDPVDRYPRENARAHRAILDGDFLAVAWCYTPDDQRARFTTEESYELWLRRSIDGGQTWLDPQEVSQLATTALNVFEPRMVMPAKTGQHLPGAFVVAWSTQTNVVEGQEEAVPLDLWVTRTRDAGETFEPVVPLAAREARESECQLRVDDAAREVYAVYMRQAEGGPSEAVYARARSLRAPPGTAALLCPGNGLGAPCPCGNESAESSLQGCRNSTVAGALLLARGGEGPGREGLTLVASHLPPRTWAGLLVADGLMLGGEGVAWGDGLRCVGGAVALLGPREADDRGLAIWGPGVLGTGLFPPGEPRFLQVLYRDPWGGPCGSTFNLSNALRVD